jgi:hypothetical protein
MPHRLGHLFCYLAVWSADRSVCAWDEDVRQKGISWVLDEDGFREKRRAEAGRWTEIE